MVLLFLAYLFLTRYLGPHRYGQFQFVLSYVTLFGVIIDFGIQQYVIKKMSEDRSQVKKYFHNFLAVEIVLATLIYGGMITFAYFNHYEPIVLKAIMVAGLGTAVHGLIYPFLAVITTFYDLKKVAFLNFLASIINVAMIFITIAVGGGIVLLVSQQLIYALCALVCYRYFVRKHIGTPEILKGLFHLDWKLIKVILIASPPFALLVGFATLYNRIDVVLIKHFYDYTQVGLYAAAYKFFDLLAFFPAVVSHSLYPLLSTLMAERNIAEVRSILEKYLRFMVALALPIGVGGSLLAKQIIGILSPEYSGAASILSILVWAPAILFMYIVVNSLVISQLTKWAVAITGVNVVVNIVGNIILLPRIGIIGAAMMTVVSELLQGIFYFYFVKKKITDFRFFSLIWQPVVASLVMGAAVWFVRDTNLMIGVGVGLIVYAVTLFVLRFFRKDDLIMLRAMFGKSLAPAEATTEIHE